MCIFAALCVAKIFLYATYCSKGLGMTKHQTRLKYLFYVCLFAFASNMLSSCVTSRKVNYFQPPSDDIPAYTDTLSYEEYTIRVHDRLYIQVYTLDQKMTALFNGGQNSQNVRQIARGTNNGSVSELYTYLVDDGGFIKFPTLGKVEVVGLTTRELKHKLEQMLSTMIVQRGEMPNLSVDIQVVQRFFSVIGANSSGRFPIQKEKTTIFEAIALFGDIADFGDRSKVKIVRQIGDSTSVRTFDVRSKDIVNSEFYYVEPNDVIYIRKMKGEAFGINSASAAISVVTTTISFGVFIYTLVDRFIIQPIERNKNQSTSSTSAVTQ